MNNFFYGEIPLYIFFGVCLTVIFFLLSFLAGYHKGFKDAMRGIGKAQKENLPWQDLP